MGKNKTKNNWLKTIVDVEFPTNQSLVGQALYLEHIEKANVKEITLPVSLSEEEISQVNIDSFVLVDFHRLTIAFAILQSKFWENQNDAAMVIEFLTQIILEAEYELWLGFEKEKLIAAAMVSNLDTKELLISDLICLNDEKVEMKASKVWAKKLYVHLKSIESTKLTDQKSFYIEDFND